MNDLRSYFWYINKTLASAEYNRTSNDEGSLYHNFGQHFVDGTSLLGTKKRLNYTFF